MPYLQTVDSEILAAVFEIYGSVIFKADTPYLLYKFYIFRYYRSTLN